MVIVKATLLSIKYKTSKMNFSHIRTSEDKLKKWKVMNINKVYPARLRQYTITSHVDQYTKY